MQLLLFNCQFIEIFDETLEGYFEVMHLLLNYQRIQHEPFDDKPLYSVNFKKIYYTFIVIQDKDIFVIAQCVNSNKIS